MIVKRNLASKALNDLPRSYAGFVKCLNGSQGRKSHLLIDKFQRSLFSLNRQTVGQEIWRLMHYKEIVCKTDTVCDQLLLSVGDVKSLCSFHFLKVWGQLCHLFGGSEPFSYAGPCTARRPVKGSSEAMGQFRCLSPNALSASRQARRKLCAAQLC